MVSIPRNIWPFAALAFMTHSLLGDEFAYVTADFLYWTARESGLAFAIIDHQHEINTPAKKAHVKQAPTEWHAGFKVGAGGHLPYDAWDLYARWTHWQQNPTREIHAHKGEKLFAPWLAPTLETNRPGEARAQWRLHFNSYDLEIGRAFCFSNWLILRPHLGLEGASINQNLDIVYKNSPAGINPFMKSRRAGFEKAKVDLKNNFWGVGLCGGIDSLWKFNENWGLFADVQAAALWGRFHTAADEDHFLVTNGTEKESIVDLENHRSTVKANLQYLLGVSWDEYFSWYHLTIRAGFEQQLWFGQNQIIHFDSFNLSGQSHRENTHLSLSGLTVETRFDF